MDNSLLVQRLNFVKFLIGYIIVSALKFQCTKGQVVELRLSIENAKSICRSFTTWREEMEPILDENDLKSLFSAVSEKPPEDILGLPPVAPKPLPKEGKTIPIEVQPPKSIEISKTASPISENAFVYPKPVEGAIYPPSTRKEKVFKFLGDIKYTILKFATIFVLVFVLTYSLINGAALTKKFKYFWETTYNKKSAENLQTPPPFEATAEAVLAIPKISLEAPISWNVDDSSLNQKLLEGVAHYRGTSLPGGAGNVFITGHSSYYSWVRSPYKDVFALLDKLNVGDKIYIRYGDRIFTYQVTSSKVVSPDKLEVLESTGTYTLTLMTCVPIGTNLNRLIVIASQIDPQPSSTNVYF